MTYRRATTDDSYQVDAIVALFAILIVLLLTLVTATASDDSDAITNYRPTDVDSSPTKIALSSDPLPPTRVLDSPS